MAISDTIWTALWVIFGLGTLLAYSLVLTDAWGQYSIHRDRRSLRELAAAVALFMAAVLAFVAITSIIFGFDIIVRRTASALAFGAFGAVGAIMATDRKRAE